MDTWDVVTGGEPKPESDKPKRSTGKDSSKGSGSSRGSRQQDRPKNVRPAEVSERMWGMAEQWIDLGTAALGHRPPVNLEEFSKRFSSTARRDPEVKRMFKARGMEYVENVLVRMIELFWESGDPNRSAGTSQFVFLHDEWDDLIYDAETSLEVRRRKAIGRTIPAPVYDQEAIRAHEERMKQFKIQAWCREVLAKEPAPIRKGNPEAMRAFRDRVRNRQKGIHHDA